jgi:hypothetical protein
MQYEFERLAGFIDSTLLLYQHQQPNAAVPGFDKIEQFVGDEIARLKKHFISFLLQMENERRIEIFVQHHQTRVILLIDRISRCREINDIKTSRRSSVKTKTELCNLFFKVLEELLTFIETYFSEYFDLDVKIPDAYRLLERRSMEEVIEALDTFTRSEKIDARLMEVALAPLHDFIDDESEGKISFRNLIYLKSLVRDISWLTKKGDETDIKFDIIEVLVYRNFNSHHFLVYLTDQIRLETQDLPTVTEQLDKLNSWMKTLQQIQAKIGSALKPDKLPIKEQITGWLKDEIDYLQKKRQIHLMLPPGEAQAPIDSRKIGTNFSVPHLAFLTRILWETGFFAGKNQTEIIEFIARHFSSSNREAISFDSLRSKYYNIEKGAVTSVQAFLTKLLDNTKKTKWLMAGLVTNMLTESITTLLEVAAA